MAKKSDTQTQFRSITADIRAGKFAPVYILMGEEAYYIDAIVNLLEEKVVAPDDRDFNMVSYFGADADIGAVVSAAQQYPVMAPRQLVMLKEAQGMLRAKDTLDKIAPYVAHPTPTTVFVVAFKGGALNATGALLKAAAKSGAVVFTSAMLRDYELAVPVKEYCDSRRISIDQKAVAMLCEYVGSPLSKLFGEIDKLIVAAGPAISAGITTDLIEKNIGQSKDYSNFALVDAVSVKDYVKAMRIVNYFSRNSDKETLFNTAGTLFSYFVKLVIVKMLPDKSDASVMAALEARQAWQIRSVKDGMRCYTARQAVNAVHHLREFDVKSKGVGSTQSVNELLRELIFKLFT